MSNPRAERLREAAAETVEKTKTAPADSHRGVSLCIQSALYFCTAKIIDSLPSEEERLRNAILTGMIADPNNRQDMDTYFHVATVEARALLAAGGEE